MVINGNGSDRHIRNALEELKQKQMGSTHEARLESNPAGRGVRSNPPLLGRQEGERDSVQPEDGPPEGVLHT